MITLFAVLFTALSVDGKESFYVQVTGKPMKIYKNKLRMSQYQTIRYIAYISRLLL